MEHGGFIAAAAVGQGEYRPLARGQVIGIGHAAGTGHLRLQFYRGRRGILGHNISVRSVGIINDRLIGLLYQGSRGLWRNRQGHRRRRFRQRNGLILDVPRLAAEGLSRCRLGAMGFRSGDSRALRSAGRAATCHQSRRQKSCGRSFQFTPHRLFTPLCPPDRFKPFYSTILYQSLSQK
ncbi:hypothetical protein DSECCO2_393510 [anaerobic digester metagenome]